MLRIFWEQINLRFLPWWSWLCCHSKSVWPQTRCLKSLAFCFPLEGRLKTCLGSSPQNWEVAGTDHNSRKSHHFVCDTNFLQIYYLQWERAAQWLGMPSHEVSLQTSSVREKRSGETHMHNVCLWRSCIKKRIPLCLFFCLLNALCLCVHISHIIYHFHTSKWPLLWCYLQPSSLLLSSFVISNRIVTTLTLYLCWTRGFFHLVVKLEGWTTASAS